MEIPGHSDGKESAYNARDLGSIPESERSPGEGNDYPLQDSYLENSMDRETWWALYCHPAYLTYMQSTSCEMWGWMKYKLESRLLEEISITSDMQMTPPLWQKMKN